MNDLMSLHGLYGLGLYKDWSPEAFLSDFSGETDDGNPESGRHFQDETQDKVSRKRIVPLSGSQDDFFKGLLVKNAFALDRVVLTRVPWDGQQKAREKAATLFGFDLFENWHIQFPSDDLSPDHVPSRGVDPRLQEFAKRIDLQGLKVLELGCLEGHHSIDLQSLGAGRVTSVEGRKENFLKSLIVKNAFALDRCTFLLGDIKEVLTRFSDPFDVCLALGILYHFKDPIPVIHRIAELSRAVFVWMHYSDHESPEGVFTDVQYRGKTYRGKYVSEDIQHRLSGLDGESFLICEEDLPRVFRDAGFPEVEIINKEKAPNGPAVTLLARKV